MTYVVILLFLLPLTIILSSVLLLRKLNPKPPVNSTPMIEDVWLPQSEWQKIHDGQKVRKVTEEGKARYKQLAEQFDFSRYVCSECSSYNRCGCPQLDACSFFEKKES